MSKKYILGFVRSFAVLGVFTCHFSFSQNIAINTDGSAAETNLMLDIKGKTAKATTGIQNIFQVKSNDAAYQLKLRLVLGTNVTAASMYGAIEVADSTGAGTRAYRNLSLQPNGGNVGVGVTVPGSSTKLQVAGRGLFTTGSFDPGDGSPAGVGISFDGAAGHIEAIQTGIAGYPIEINHYGKVGIGIANPTAKLHVDAGDIGVSRIDGGDVSPYARFGLSNSWEQYLANNAFFNSATAQWNYVVPAGYGGLASTMNQTSGTINFETTSGGVNPITWASRLHIANNGAISVNGVGNYGTSGQVLTSQGNAPPIWAAAGGGGGGACAATTVTSELTGNGGSPCASPCTGGNMTLRQCASTCNGLNYSGFTDWYAPPIEVLASLGSIAPDNGNTTQIWTVTGHQATAGAFEWLKLSDYTTGNTTATQGFTNACRCVR